MLPLLTALLSGCSSQQGRELNMLVADELIQEIGPLKKPRYTEAELPALFSELQESGNRYCAMLYGSRPFDEAEASRFVQPGELYWKQGRESRWNVKAGCWNFYQMNDKDPQLDFQLVAQLYPAEGYDCYAVGLMQPYIMHNTLGCRSLTTLDFDWRIQEAHWELLQRFRAGSLSSPEQLQTSLSSLPVSYIAYDRVLQERYRVSINTLCNPRQNAMCSQALVDFQRGYADISHIQLDLAPLHELELVESALPRVLFLSNAIEERYTTRAQFDQLIARLTAGLAPDQPAVLIHHVGGFPTMGIYTLRRTETGSTITTACRDTYYHHPATGNRGTYKTWFEAVSTTAQPPTCAALLRGK